MKITIVSDVLGEENNGTTLVTMNLYRYLKAYGHEVCFLCADESKKGIDGYYVVPNLNLGPFNSYVKKNGVSLAKPKKDIIELAVKDADLVYIMIPLALGAATAKIAYEMNKPIIGGFHMQAENFSSHVHMQNINWFNKAVYKFIYKHMFKYLDAIHYPTQFIRDTFEHNIKRETNGYVISNGVNNYIKKIDAKKPDEYRDKIVILSSGRYSREKDQITLIKAIYKSKYKDQIQLILAGKGPLQKKYEKAGRKLKNKPLLKFYSRDEIINVLNYADLYVHPAIMELEGIACTEAISIGKLVIVCDSKKSATKNFAVSPDLIFKDRKPSDLASKIDYIIENPKLKSKYESMYMAEAINFNQDKCMESMINMIEEVYKKHNG